MRSIEYLYLTEDLKRVVNENVKEGRFLFATPGTEISQADMKKYGLKEGEFIPNQGKSIQSVGIDAEIIEREIKTDAANAMIKAVKNEIPKPRAKKKSGLIIDAGPETIPEPNENTARE
jgi:hypothetical protein